MKIGILTFHSQQNYGGLLQCWALGETLRKMGHSVVVLDRWTEKGNVRLRGFCAYTLADWCRFLIKILVGREAVGSVVRTLRTIHFVKGFGLSAYHFYDWDEVSNGTDVDLIVVGSDQVWHCGDWGDPRPYLLLGLKDDVRAISYAASFGMMQIPEDKMSLYANALPRFAAISCREREGVRICNQMALTAEHVVDPTLLIDADEWREFSHAAKITTGKKRLVCYCLQADVDAMLPVLEKYAVQNDWRVDVLPSGGPIHPFPNSVRRLVKNWRRYRNLVYHHSAGPRQFVRILSKAQFVITDSYHALMFAAHFNLNVRFLKPNEMWRGVMFARVKEFEDDYVTGSLICCGFEEALASFCRGEKNVFDYGKIESRIKQSLNWLKGALGE